MRLMLPLLLFRRPAPAPDPTAVRVFRAFLRHLERLDAQDAHEGRELTREFAR